MFFIDWTYIVIVLPFVVFAMIASANVNSTFKKYSRVSSSWGLTGAEVARRILDSEGLNDVRVEMVRGHLSDHYDPRARAVRLSESTYSSTSCAAIGVASHEVGHAIQHERSYFPLKVRTAIIPITNFGSRLALPLILIGILFSYYSEVFSYVAYIGVACFALSALFQLVTLPVEFNASKRALKILDSSHILTSEELPYARKVLTAAAMTYVAALAVSLAQILRLLLVIGRRRR